MNIVIKQIKDISPVLAHYHILTYAEEGFAPLNIHTKRYDLPETILKEYANRCNETDQVTTMLPKCNLSMLPRRLLRESKDSFELYAKLLDFFDLNSSEIKAKNFIFDFRTHELPRYVIEAIYMLESNDALENIEEILIIK